MALVYWEKECGFIWIEELVAELESYENQRDRYPTLESYMPKIIEAYKIWAKKYRKLDLQDKTSLTKRVMDKYDRNSVTGRMSAGTQAA